MKNLDFCMVVMEWNAEWDMPAVICVYPLPDVLSTSLFTLDVQQIKKDFITKHGYKKYILLITTLEEG